MTQLSRDQPLQPSKKTLQDVSQLADTIKLACFDIDGTLYGSRHEVSAATKQACGVLKERGIRRALATGRPSFATEKLQRELEIDAPSLFFSGSLVLDPVSGRAILSESFAPNVVKELLHFARNNQLYVELYTKDGFFVEREHDYARIHAGYLGAAPTVANLDLLPATEIIKILFLVKRNTAEHEAAEQARKANPHLSYGLSVGGQHPEHVFYNITTSAGTRERCLALMTTALGITEDQVIAFGDASSDVPFLSRVGIGVAMGNAPQEVKDRAGIITRNVDDDGVAFAINTLFKR